MFVNCQTMFNFCHNDPFKVVLLHPAAVESTVYPLWLQVTVVCAQNPPLRLQVTVGAKGDACLNCFPSN